VKPGVRIICLDHGPNLFEALYNYCPLFGRPLLLGKIYMCYVVVLT
jgi:hypothetical protein